jgi:hypothetical protein
MRCANCCPFIGRYGRLFYCEGWRYGQDEYPQTAYLLRALRAAQAVDAGEIAQQYEDQSQIPERVRLARVAAVERAIRKS